MGTLKKAQVVLLPGNNETTIYYFDKTKRLGYFKDSKIAESLEFEKRHLYIITNDEIEVGDWFLTNLSIIKQSKEIKNQSIIDTFGGEQLVSICKKIKSTTNKSLNISQLSQQFIEGYIAEYNKDNIINNVLPEEESFALKYGSKIKVWDDEVEYATTGFFVGFRHHEFNVLVITDLDFKQTTTLTAYKNCDTYIEEKVQLTLYDISNGLGVGIPPHLIEIIY